MAVDEPRSTEAGHTEERPEVSPPRELGGPRSKYDPSLVPNLADGKPASTTKEGGAAAGGTR